MSGSVSYRVSVDHSNGNRKQPFKPTQKTFTQSANRGVDTVQAIGTTEELVALGDIAGVPELICFENLDPTNYVEIGIVVSAVFKPVLQVDPGRVAGPLKPSSSFVLYAKAHTAACDIRVCAYSA